MSADSATLSGPWSDWKQVYRVLHAHLLEHTELIDSELFSDLQRALQKQARAEGVDLADHGAWDRWLGNHDAPSCEERFSPRAI